MLGVNMYPVRSVFGDKAKIGRLHIGNNIHIVFLGKAVYLLHKREQFLAVKIRFRPELKKGG